MVRHCTPVSSRTGCTMIAECFSIWWCFMYWKKWSKTLVTLRHSWSSTCTINSGAQSLRSGKLSLLSQFQRFSYLLPTSGGSLSGNPRAISLLGRYRVLAIDPSSSSWSKCYVLKPWRWHTLCHHCMQSKISRQKKPKENSALHSHNGPYATSTSPSLVLVSCGTELSI